MIQASLNDTKRIEGISPLFAKAFEYIKNTDFSKMEDGRHDIEGDASIEIHKKYIDIQIPLLGVEQIGWKATCDLLEEASPYNEEQDIAFFIDKPTTVTRIYPGQFVIFFPEDGHAPGIGEGMIRKIVVKVKI